MEPEKQPLGLLLCDDLIFASRIGATARSLGLTVRTVRSATHLQQLAEQEKPACAILDLGNPSLASLEIAEVVRQLRPDVPVIVGYGSHVDAAGLNAARQAGCDVVLPRSKFVEDLAAALPGWFAGPAT
jgi:CheY-like chemotaxis protein